MIRVEITGEKYQVPKVLKIVDSDADQIIQAIDEAYTNQDHLQLVDSDGVHHLFPYIALQFVTDFRIESVGE